MSQLTPARRTLAILALALGGFAIGTTEFVAMGLLPNIAEALLPGQYAADPDGGVAHAGWLVSAYALGVVVGAPTIAAMSAKFPRKGLLMVLLVGFAVATVASAVLPSFGLVLVARFVAGLPHGAYFGIASIVAGDIMGPGKRGKGIALVLLGLSVANVVGVPAVTWIGQVASWRIAYGVVAALFVLTFFAVSLFVPRSGRDVHATIGRELRAFRVPQVWIVMSLGAVGFGGFFAVYSYISPLVQNVTGLSESAVPLVLVVVGLGMVVGGLLGGFLADRSVKATIFVGLFALVGALLVTVLTAQWVAGLFIGAFLLGATSSAIPPAVQSRLMDVAGDARTIAAALNHSAFNLGNSLGAALGGAVIAAGFGFVAPGWLGIGLALLGVVVAVISYAVENRTNRRAAAVRTAGPAPARSASRCPRTDARLPDAAPGLPAGRRARRTLTAPSGDPEVARRAVGVPGRSTCRLVCRTRQVRDLEVGGARPYRSRRDAPARSADAAPGLPTGRRALPERRRCRPEVARHVAGGSSRSHDTPPGSDGAGGSATSGEQGTRLPDAAPGLPAGRRARRTLTAPSGAPRSHDVPSASRPGRRTRRPGQT